MNGPSYDQSGGNWSIVWTARGQMIHIMNSTGAKWWPFNGPENEHPGRGQVIHSKWSESKTSRVVTVRLPIVRKWTVTGRNIRGKWSQAKDTVGTVWMQMVRKRTVTGNNSQGAKGRWANNQLGHEGSKPSGAGMNGLVAKWPTVGSSARSTRWINQVSEGAGSFSIKKIRLPGVAGSSSLRLDYSRNIVDHEVQRSLFAVERGGGVVRAKGRGSGGGGVGVGRGGWGWGVGGGGLWWFWEATHNDPHILFPVDFVSQRSSSVAFFFPFFLLFFLVGKTNEKVWSQWFYVKSTSITSW